MTTIGLIRHGLTSWNGEGRMQGQKDIPLNDEGRRQARALAARLAEGSWDFVASSDLDRAQETASIIAERNGIPLLPNDTRLRERNFGLLEGTTEAERIQQWGPHWKSMKLGVETNEQIVERGLSYIEELLAVYPGKSILIVSHGGFLAVMLHALLKEEKIEKIQNTSLSIIQKSETAWKELLYNCTSHLK
jgi:probable phosphoglycerate mutase